MTILRNDPVLWKHLLPKAKADGHKYDRGVAVIVGAPTMTGATRLAAESCARVGAGLVKVIAPNGTGNIYRTALPAHIIVEDEEPDLSISRALLRDSRTKAFLLGPGCASDPFFADLFRMARRENDSVPIVLDAGAFLAWKDAVAEFKSISSALHTVITPHDGEFAAFFGGALTGDKDAMAKEAASALDATVVLKGARTVIADGNGQTLLQERDIAALSTAGTGDVLAGMIAGLIAQGMAVQAASAAAVWIHAEAAARFGPGMVASDLPGLIPPVLSELSSA